MLKGGNHQASPLITHGFLVGIEIEEGRSIDLVMNRMVDAVTYLDGIGRVEAEHIGEMGDYKSLEEEVLEALASEVQEVKES